jgi:FG-GAP repeat
VRNGWSSNILGVVSWRILIRYLPIIIIVFFSFACTFEASVVSKDSQSSNTIPSKPTAITLGQTPFSLSKSPSVKWQAGVEPISGIKEHQIQILKSDDNMLTLDWTAHVSENIVTGINLLENTQYFLKVRAVGNNGEISEEAISDNWLSYSSPQLTQEAFIKAINVGASDYFGEVLAIDGDTLVVGAYDEDSNQTTITNGPTASADNTLGGSGAVYVYKRNNNQWSQEAYIKAVNSDANDEFGRAVAIYGDTIVVGASREDANQSTITNGTTASNDDTLLSAGAAYVYKRTNNTWAQEAYIKASNADSNDFFGSAVAIHGDTIAIGAYGEDSNQTVITNGAISSLDNSESVSGAVYIYSRTNLVWSQQAYIKAVNILAGEYFGEHLALYGDTLAVASSYEDGNQTTITNGTTATFTKTLFESGAVYIYKRTGVNWGQEAYIKASNADAYDNFAYSLDLHFDTLVVGAWQEGSNQTSITNGTSASIDNTKLESGAAYVFKRNGNLWNQEAYLKAVNAEGGDWLGYRVAIHNDTIAVGALSEDSGIRGITQGETASSDNSSSLSGATYIYKRSGNNWSQFAYVKSINSDANDFFGMALDIQGDTLVVGASQEDSSQSSITNGVTASGDNTVLQSGAVYVYKLSGLAPWTQQAYVKPSNLNAGDFFGYSNAISGDTVIIGAHQEDSNQTTIDSGTTASADNSALNAGAAYIFKRSGSTWNQEAYLKAPNSGANDVFGYRVSINGDTAVVGAYLEDSNQTTITNGTTATSDDTSSNSGAVYVFKRTGSTWTQEAYIKAENNDSSDQFGWVVDIDGDTILVTAVGENSAQTTITNGSTASADNSAANAGAAYIYKRTGTNWVQEAYLKASNAEANDQFGYYGAIEGDTVAIGANEEDSNQTTISNSTTSSPDNTATNSGAVYIFKRQGVNWAQEAYLKASNSGIGDEFGFSVSISGNVVVVGASGEDSNQTTISNGSVAASDNSASSAGAAYVYRRTGSTWAEEAYLKASNAGAADYFGWATCVQGDTIIVSAIGEDSSQNIHGDGSSASADDSYLSSGAVYVFKRINNLWTQESYLKAPNSGSSYRYGFSVNLDQNTLVIGSRNEASSQTTIINGLGAPSDTNAVDAGSIYILTQ